MSQSRDNWETRTRFYEKECLLDAMTPEERLESPASRRCSFKGKGGTIVAWDTSKKTFAVEVDECGADGKWVTVDVKEADIIWNESEPPLIVGEDEWLSQPFFKALTAIFQAFDKDEDGLLSRFCQNGSSTSRPTRPQMRETIQPWTPLPMHFCESITM